MLKYSQLATTPKKIKPQAALLSATAPGVPGTAIPALKPIKEEASSNTPIVNVYLPTTTPAVTGDPGQPVSAGDTGTGGTTPPLADDSAVPFYKKWQTWAIGGGALVILAVALFLILKKKK